MTGDFDDRPGMAEMKDEIMEDQVRAGRA